MAYVKGTRAVSINDVTGAALVRRLYLYTAAVPQNPAAVDFVRFAISPEGQNIVGKGPFVPDSEDSGIWDNPTPKAPPPGEDIKAPATEENAQRNDPAPAPPVDAVVPEVSTELNKAIIASLQAPPPMSPAPDAPAAQPVAKVAPQEALTPPVAITSHAVTATDYPLTSIRTQEEGKVLIRYLVRDDGSVGDCNVTTSSGKSLLDDAACAMVKRHWKFKPAMQNGKPVAKSLTAEVIFKLH
jgi:protein TonB